MFATGRAAHTSGSAPDTQFNYVTMLLNGDGTNGKQNNTFLDSSSNAFSITRNGNTTQGSFSPYGNFWSALFGGTLSGSGITAIGNSGNFTIEGWYYFNTLSNQTLFSTNASSGSSTLNVFLELGSSAGEIRFALRNDSGTTLFDFNSTSNVSLNTWTHIAWVLSGTTATIYINGVASGTATLSGTRTCTSTYYYVGSLYDGTRLMSGFLSNFRYVNGTAVYTSNFTPPTAPLSAITNTKFLTCQSNRFIDNSGLSVPITATASIQRFSPFNPTSAYSTTTIGGSGYFDGSGDYLSWSGTTFGTSAFTIEGWFYLSTMPTGGTSFFAIIGSNGSLNALNVRIASSTSINLDNSVTGQSFTVPTMSINTWYHVAAVRNSSNQTTVFLNGIRSSTGAVSISWNLSVASTYVGNHNDGSNHYFNGYLSGLQLLAGSNSYDPTASTITVPTAPPTNITNTALLLNYTNAGIPDNAMMNDLETVNNAQVSTSVKKYGTGSLKFAGTTDALVVPYQNNGWPDFTQVNQFTVECWVYLNAYSSSQSTILGNRLNGGSGFEFRINASGYLQIYNTGGASPVTSSITVPLTTWTYVTAVKTSASSLTLYINGVNVGTGTFASATGNTNAMYIGGDGTGAATLFNGYIDDLRITKGIARYSTTFTPPTTALPTY